MTKVLSKIVQNKVHFVLENGHENGPGSGPENGIGIWVEKKSPKNNFSRKKSWKKLG